MKKYTAIVYLLSFYIIIVYSQGLGSILQGQDIEENFNRISLVIPANWYYSINPKEKPETDQLQLFSEDRNRTVLITLTKDRPDIDFIEAEHSSRFEMLRRAMSIHGFEKCIIDGQTQDEDIWGRKGIFTKFLLYKNEKKNPDEIMMHIYNYGEQISKTKEVLFITAFIIGPEYEDTNKLVKSLKILDK